MHTVNDVHLQFAQFFKSKTLQPYAYLVSKKLSEGNICLILDQPGLDTEWLPSDFADSSLLENETEVGTATDPNHPFILHNRRLYLARYFNYETRILRRIEELTTNGMVSTNMRYQELLLQLPLIDLLFPVKTGEMNWQRAAALASMMSNFSIITGGPGTGKTTTVAKILSILLSQSPELKIAIAAPTGKAAARLAESLKNIDLPALPEIGTILHQLEPATIHRLLGSIPDSPYFKHNRTNPLPHDVIVIDESSMIDVALFAKLLDAVDEKARIIFLGDKDQLASVEAGSLFGDLCNSGVAINDFSDAVKAVIEGKSQLNELKCISVETKSDLHPLAGHIVELQFSHRFDREKGIGKLSRAIIDNDKAALLGANHDQVLIDTDYSDSIFNDFVQGYAEYIREIDILQAFKKLQKVKVLCAVREGGNGVKAVNKKIESILGSLGLISPGMGLYENCPIMITRNNHTLGLFNGDIGIVRRDEKGSLRVWFETSDGAVRSILPGFISYFEKVYAMTIHKSQGSEFSRVLIVLPGRLDSPVLTRELLYTAVTRAKDQVVIQGSEAEILAAAERKVQRASGISERFLGSKSAIHEY